MIKGEWPLEQFNKIKTIEKYFSSLYILLFCRIINLIYDDAYELNLFYTFADYQLLRKLCFRVIFEVVEEYSGRKTY